MVSRRSAAPDKPSKPEQGPGAEPPLSRHRIAATAVGLLDSDGVAGLTMRKLADRLDAGVMSLYWHVDNKEAVFDLALDTVLEYRRAPDAPAPQDWRQDILHVLEDWRAVMLRHPWSASLLPRQVLGRNILDRLEFLSKTLSKAGVADADLNAAIWSLWNYVMGAAITRASFERSQAEGADAKQGLENLGENHPTIGRSGLLLDDDWDGAFRKGLGFLLDGISTSGTAR